MIDEDVIELSSNVSLEQLKARVKEWLRGSIGKKYSFQLFDEYHVRLSRVIHEKKYCLISCLGPFLGLIPLMFLVVTLPYGALYAFFVLIVGYLAFIFICAIVGYGFFFLKTEEIMMDLLIDQGQSLRIRVGLKIPSEEYIHEYESLKHNILQGSASHYTGPEPW